MSGETDGQYGEHYHWPGRAMLFEEDSLIMFFFHPFKKTHLLRRMISHLLGVKYDINKLGFLSLKAHRRIFHLRHLNEKDA